MKTLVASLERQFLSLVLRRRKRKYSVRLLDRLGIEADHNRAYVDQLEPKLAEKARSFRCCRLEGDAGCTKLIA
jgi:hypothetical protein